MPEPLLSVRNLDKSFPGVQALKGVNLGVERGEIHALVGENGAGKSTLMKILFGIYRPDSGTITLKGKPFLARSPTEALRSGIAMIHQEISPVPNLTVAENLFLGREDAWNVGFGVLKKKVIEDKARRLFDDLGIDIDVNAGMSTVSIANAQLVAIAMAVSYDSDLIIMDEPTSALTEREVEHLYKIIRDLRKRRGITVIYITHKLDEVFAVCDRVTVLRDGEVVVTDSAGNLTKEQMIFHMVGREVSGFYNKKKVPIGETIFEVENLSLPGVFENVSFSLRAGEILGVAGLVGSGRTELMEAIFGFRTGAAGRMRIRGKPLMVKTPMDAIRNRIGFVTEDRKLTGLFLSMGVADNMVMPDMDAYTPRGVIQSRRLREACGGQVDAMQIRTPSLDQWIMHLSGGNQQKVLIARWILMRPDILILDEPTRGIDVGAKASIHELIVELAGMGKGIIMVSSEMAEILSMSDRILTMHEGRIYGELSRADATSQRIMKMATGESA
jgi:inositol transport system ATP-binding protein